MTLGDKLSKLRKDNNYTQEQLAFSGTKETSNLKGWIWIAVFVLVLGVKKESSLAATFRVRYQSRL